MQRFTSEQMRPVREVFRRVTGSAPHPATVCRWALRGAGGVILETYMVGNRRMTTEVAVREFIRRRTEATTPQPPADPDKVSKELARELS